MKDRILLTYIATVTTMILLSSCNTSKPTDVDLGQSNTSELITTTSPIVTTTETVTTQRELTTKEKLQNTSWVGCDGNQNIMSVHFDESQVTVTTNGYQNNVTGFWDIDDQKFTVYSDESFTEQITYYDYTLHELENDTSLLYMEGMYLSKMDNNTTTFETICESMDSKYNLLSTVTDGSYWVGANSVNADFFVCNYGDIYLYIANFNSESTTYYDGKWGITYNDGMYMIDNESGDFIYFKWQLDENTSKLYLTPLDGSPLKFTRTEASSFGEAISIVNSHLDGSYVEVTTTEETTTEITTIETTLESSIGVETDAFGNVKPQSNENMYFDNPIDVNVNPDDENYDDHAEYYDNYTKAPENLYPQYYYTTPVPQYSYDYNNYNNNYSYNYNY